MNRSLRACLLFGTLLLPTVTAVRVFSQRTDTAPATSLKVAGLLDQTTIRRDDRGIPYIDAKNDHDLYFAQGYATASDRLWQMDLLRRTARGELAEVLGAGPNNLVLEQDKLHRTFGFAQVADAELSQATPAARAVLEAYAQGVNSFITSLGPKSLPPEFQILQYSPRPWTAADSLVVVKLFFEALSSSWRLDVMREVYATLPEEKRAVLLPETSPLDVLVVGSDSRRRNAALSKKSTIRGGSPTVKEGLASGR